MSLLEDVFLEDEAGEAQELERIIEGDEYDDRPRALSPDSDDNSEKEDEAEEDKRRVDPTSAKPKRVVKNPRVVLNPARLMGPRGIQVIPEHFKEFKFKGKGYEKEDLDLVLKKLEHWAYRLYPKFQFDDCLKKIETLGKKRPVVVHLTKIRSDQYISEETVVQRESSDDETPQPAPEEDEFDKLLQQQIDLARATPVSVRKQGGTPMVDRLNMPKATSSPSINEEQRERMLRNRQMAEERRLARLKQNADTNVQDANASQSQTKDSNSLENDSSYHLNTNKNYSPTKNNRSIDSDDELLIKENANGDISNENKHGTNKKLKSSKSNVIDSSDDEEGLVVNEPITADVHYKTRDTDNSDNDSLDRNNEDLDERNTERHDIEMKENNAKSQKDVEATRIVEKSTFESDNNMEDSKEINKACSQRDIEVTNTAMKPAFDENSQKEIEQASDVRLENSAYQNSNDVMRSQIDIEQTEVLRRETESGDIIEGGVISSSVTKLDNSKESNKVLEDDCVRFGNKSEIEKTGMNEKKNDADKENEFEDMELDFSDDF